MNAHASIPYIEVESSLQAVLNKLEGHEDMPLSIRYEDRVVQAGYHISEVKAGSFVTLDCGGNPDEWGETVLQVEDIPSKDDRPMMTAGKFMKILDQVDRKVRLNHESRLTIEIGQPGEAMRVFDVADLSVDESSATLTLGVRAAICKPRHRAQQAESSSCCSPNTQAAATCC